MFNYYKINYLDTLVEEGTLKTIHMPIPQAKDKEKVAPTYLQFEAFAFLDKFSSGYGQREIKGNIHDGMFWIYPSFE
jgi:hypothetical protein